MDYSYFTFTESDCNVMSIFIIIIRYLTSAIKYLGKVLSILSLFFHSLLLDSVSVMTVFTIYGFRKKLFLKLHKNAYLIDITNIKPGIYLTLPLYINSATFIYAILKSELWYFPLRQFNY